MKIRLTTLLLFLLPTLSLADTFDRYTNPILAKAADSPHVKPISKLTSKLVAEHNDLFQETGGVLLIVRTNGGNHAKLLAQFARQKAGMTTVPMALLERATAYKPGHDRALQALAPLVHLYNGFQFNLDLGQVVAPEVGGDLRYVDTPDGGYLEPLKDAKLYLVTKHLPGTEPKKQPGRTTLGEAFDPATIAGSYTLHDDGRRTAHLEITVDAEGNLTGGYTSQQTGRRYDLTGKLTPTAKHHLTFQVKFPNSTQDFTGYVFTKDASSICGSTKLQGQEFGFYAVREK
jgi:hypothetical protein